MRKKHLLFYSVLVSLVLVAVYLLWPEKEGRNLNIENPATQTDSKEEPLLSDSPKQELVQLEEEIDIAPEPAEIPLEEQLVWARERAVRMKKLIRDDPEQALAEALTPREIAALDPKVAAEVEQWVGGKGFYGVLAICGENEQGHQHSDSCRIQHDVVIDNTPYLGHIYGKRLHQLTTESDSLYGVVVDGEIALHEDQIVSMDPDALVENLAPEEVAVMYNGELRVFAGKDAFSEWVDKTLPNRN
jgi:hypothetical protein